MKQCKQSVLGLLLTGALILPATDALARKGEGGGPRGGMMKELDLTPEQREKMKELRAGDKDKMQEKRAEMEKARTELETAMKGDASDKEIRQKFENLQKVQARFAQERFEKVLAIRAILTPEQRAKFRGMMGGIGGPGGHGKLGGPGGPGKGRWGKRGGEGPAADEEEE